MSRDRIRRVSKERCAFLIIDMQNDFVEEGAPVECGPSGRALIPVIQSMKTWAYQNQIPVIYTQECHRPDLSDFGLEGDHEPPHTLEGTPGVEIVSPLAPTQRDYLIRKRRYSAFFQTDLQMLLQGLGRDTVILCGVCTNICVYGTALDALQHGMHAIILSDGVAGTSEHYHNVFLEHMEFLVGDVIDSEGLIALLDNQVS